MEADSQDVDSLDSRPQSEDSLEHSRDSLGGPQMIMLDNGQFVAAAVFVEDVSSLAEVETEAAAVEAESCQQVVMVEAAEVVEVEMSGSQEQIMDTEVLASSDITTETSTSICIVRECEVGMYLFQARMNSF